MLRIRSIALALTAMAVATTGCGSSGKSSTSSPGSSSSVEHAAGATTSAGGPLSRSQLIAAGDSICYRLNAKRLSTRIGSPKDYAREIPPLAAYELDGAEEMAKLTPPPALARDWSQMVASARKIAVITSRYRTLAQTLNPKARADDIALGYAEGRLMSVAKQAGFKDCAKFS